MPWKLEGCRIGMYDMGIVTLTWEPPVPKSKTKVPVCSKCGRKLKGRIPIDATEIICFFCDNKPADDAEEEKLTNWKDVK